MKRFVIPALCLLPCLTIFAQDDEARIKKLIEDLANDELSVREKATDELIELGEIAKEALEQVLKETDDAEVKSRIKMILKVVPLKSIIVDEIYKNALDKVKTLATESDLLKKLKILKEFERKEKIDPAKIASVVEIILEDVSDDKFSVIAKIWYTRLKSASKALLKFFEDESPLVRRGAIWAFGAIQGELGGYSLSGGSMSSAQDIEKMLKSESVDLHYTVSPRRYFDLFEREYVFEEDEPEQFKVEYIENIARMLDDKEAIVREAVAMVLTAVGAKEYTKDITKLLEDHDAKVRRQAIRSLRDLHGEECVKIISGLLEDQDSDVRAEAASALGRLKAKEYAKDIAKLLEDKDVRTSAAQALLELGAKEYLNEILKLLEDKDERVRSSIATVFWMSGITEAIEPLKKALEKEKDEMVRHQIEWAIERLEEEKRREERKDE